MVAVPEDPRVMVSEVGDALREMVAATTVCENTADVEPRNSPSPLYTAVMECVATDSELVVYAAVPLLTVPLPRLVVPS